MNIRCDSYSPMDSISIERPADESFCANCASDPVTTVTNSNLDYLLHLFFYSVKMYIWGQMYEPCAQKLFIKKTVLGEIDAG